MAKCHIGTVIQHNYKNYMENNNLAEKDREMLFHFFHEIVGCLNLMQKEKLLKGEMFSKMSQHQMRLSCYLL